MANTIKDWKKAKQKTEGDDTPVAVARRLMNLFRQMSHLDDHSVELFNQMLLAADSDALTVLNSIPGGSELQEYRTYLRGKMSGKATSTTPEGEESADGVSDVVSVEAAALPAAEALSPLWSTWGGGSGASSTDHVLTETKIHALAKDMSTCAEDTLALIEAEALAHYDDYQQKIIRLLESLVVDSDVQKMQTNLADTVEKIHQIQTQQKQDLQDRQRRNKATLCDTINQRALAILRGQSVETPRGSEDVVIEEMTEANQPTSEQVAQLLRQQQTEAPKFSIQPIGEDE